MQAGCASGSDVQRDGVADEGDLAGMCAVEMWKGVVEDPRIRLCHADEVTVDHDPHAHEWPGADLAHPTSRQHLVDLAAGVRHDTERHSGSRE